MTLVPVDAPEHEESAGLRVSLDVPERTQVERVQEDVNALVRDATGVAESQSIRLAVGNYSGDKMPEHRTVIQAEEDRLDSVEIARVQNKTVGVDQKRFTDDAASGYRQLEHEPRIVVVHNGRTELRSVSSGRDLNAPTSRRTRRALCR